MSSFWQWLLSSVLIRGGGGGGGGRGGVIMIVILHASYLHNSYIHNTWKIYKIIEHTEKRCRVDENFRSPLGVFIFLKQRTMILLVASSVLAFGYIALHLIIIFFCLTWTNVISHLLFFKPNFLGIEVLIVHNFIGFNVQTVNLLCSIKCITTL